MWTQRCGDCWERVPQGCCPEHPWAESILVAIKDVPITYTGYFDGCHNPRGTSYGALLYASSRPVWQVGARLEAGRGSLTNNVAEYCGFLALLHELLARGLQDEGILVCGDSQLVIDQQFDGRTIVQGAYVPYAQQARQLCQQFPHLTGAWIPRDANAVADALAQAILQVPPLGHDTPSKTKTPDKTKMPAPVVSRLRGRPRLHASRVERNHAYYLRRKARLDAQTKAERQQERPPEASMELSHHSSPSIIRHPLATHPTPR
jgi:ribonuclease HI